MTILTQAKLSLEGIRPTSGLQSSATSFINYTYRETSVRV